MTATTPFFGLPYPQPADARGAGANAMRDLALAVEDCLIYDASVDTAPAESAQALAGATGVDFPGAANLFGFTTPDAKVYTYTGDGVRFFMVAASVEVEVGPGASQESVAEVIHNGTAIWGSYDMVATTSSGVLDARRYTHTLAVPVRLAPGETVSVTATATGTLGITALRIYPIGPSIG